MEEDGRAAAEARPPLARPAANHADQPTARTALILYGSETGNAQDVAEEVGRLTERLRFDTTVLELDAASLRDLVRPTLVVVCISTTGQGDFPQNARRFWRTLLSGALKPGLLRKVRFTSFGLGDSSYPRFNVAHRMLHSRLVQLGAKAVCERGEGNEQHPEGHSAALRSWVVTLKEQLLAVFPLPAGQQVIADDVFLEPKWKLAMAHARPRADAEGAPDGVAEAGNAGLSSAPSPDDPPSPKPLPVHGAYGADLVRNDRVTAPDHFQDVRLLDLRVHEPYAYGPGAVAVIYPKNFPSDVQDFIDLMRWRDVADHPLRLVPAADAEGDRLIGHPSPLHDWDVSGTTLTLRWLLENVLDIMSIPRRSFFASLLHWAGTATDDERYQKERVLELGNPELIDELWDYTTRPKRTIVEVMMDFTTIQIPWQYALSALPRMKGRQFSIASGGALTRDERGRTKVELLVAIADPPSPIIKWRRRYGVCTRYIAALSAGQPLRIGLQPGYLGVQARDLDTPVVMIGPGTGVAPLRSLIHQRLAWAMETGRRPAGQRLASDMLFFGCRAPAADDFFRAEWDRLADAEGLTVVTAFSRRPGAPRRYVQDQIRAHAAAVHDALVAHHATVYLCGSSGNMPKAVREALLDVLSEQGERMSRDDAEQFLDSMEKAGRYKQETW